MIKQIFDLSTSNVLFILSCQLNIQFCCWLSITWLDGINRNKKESISKFEMLADKFFKHQHLSSVEADCVNYITKIFRSLFAY